MYNIERVGICDSTNDLLHVVFAYQFVSEFPIGKVMQVSAETSTLHELLKDVELIVVSFDTWVVLCALQEVDRFDDSWMV